LARSVSRVTVALYIVSLVSQLVSFLVGCSGMILEGFDFVAFFAGVKASSFCIHLSCPVCSLSVVRGEWSRLFCGHKGCSLPEVSITSFLSPQFFVFVRLSKSNFLTHTVQFTDYKYSTCVTMFAHKCKNAKVKCTLVQALRLSTGRTAHRGSRGIALLYRH
jgi:hypothetical protein